MNVPLFYKRKPVFGIDIGHSSIKAVQIDRNQKSGALTVLGYGFNTFQEKTIQKGVIKDPKEVAKSAYTLLTELIVGGVNTNRAAAAIPVARTFTRVLTLPQLSEEDLNQAVRLEVEQYVPMKLEELYVDYNITNRYEDKKTGPQLEVLMVAVPKAIVDSYVVLFNMLGLELSILETSLISSVRGVNTTQQLANQSKSKDKSESKNDDSADSQGATLLVDFGAKSSDLSIFDSTIRVTGTLQKGGDTITDSIADQLKLTERQAYTVKTRHGLNDSKFKDKIESALKPTLEELIKEIQKMQRYYKSRSFGTGEITNMVILGGGANLPGLSQYLEQKTKLTTSICDPWESIDFGSLQEPHKLETTMYTTAVGLSLVSMEDSND